MILSEKTKRIYKSILNEKVSAEAGGTVLAQQLQKTDLNKDLNSLPQIDHVLQRVLSFASEEKDPGIIFKNKDSEPAISEKNAINDVHNFVLEMDDTVEDYAKNVEDPKTKDTMENFLKNPQYIDKMGELGDKITGDLLKKSYKKEQDTEDQLKLQGKVAKDKPPLRNPAEIPSRLQAIGNITKKQIVGSLTPKPNEKQWKNPNAKVQIPKEGVQRVDNNGNIDYYSE